MTRRRATNRSPDYFPCVNGQLEQPWLADTVDYSVEANLEFMRREDLQALVDSWERQIEGDMLYAKTRRPSIYLGTDGPTDEAGDRASSPSRRDVGSGIHARRNVAVHRGQSTHPHHGPTTYVGQQEKVQPKAAAAIDRRDSQ